MKVLQCGCGRYFFAGEAVCAACGAPIHMAKSVTSPETKKKRLIILFCILGVLLLTLILMIVFQVGIFHPRIRLPELMAEELAADTLTPPTEEENEKVAKYLQKAGKRAYTHMSRNEKKAAEQFESLVALLSQGGEITPEALAESLGEDGAAFAAVVAAKNTLLTELHLAELQAAADKSSENKYAIIFLSDTGSTDDNEEIVLPSKAAHGSWTEIGVSGSSLIMCDACGFYNPKDAEVCENCGADLSKLLYAELQEHESAPEPVEPEEQPKYSAELLNTLANELMLHGYADIPFYLAALANIQDPLNTDVLCTCAELLKDSGNVQDALAIANHGLRIAPNEEDLLYVAGMCCIQMDDPDAAAGYFNRALRVSGGGGPGNQGMMLVSIQRQDFGSAFLYMIEGARDAFTHSIWEVYQKLKLRPDYKEISSNAFEQYSLYELMKFERNRTAFDPTLDTVGQQIQLGNLVWPSRVQDWRHSCFSMLESCISYGKNLAEAMSEETGEVVEALDILLTSKDFKDMVKRFMNSSFMPDEKTEAEMLVSYEQEMFWLSILGEYVDWKLELIQKEHAKSIPDEEIDEISEMAFSYLEENWSVAALEALDMNMGSMSDYMTYLTVVLPVLLKFQQTAETNHSYWTVEQSQKIVGRMNNVIDTYSDSVNKAYTETKILLEEYWLYANAILGLIADDSIYNEYRADQRYRVATAPTVYILETALWSFFNIFINDGVPMLGTPADGGAVTGTVPAFPKLPVSGKGATPEALMYGDIWVPSIPEVTQEVFGLTPEEIADNLAIQQMQNANDDVERWWNSLTPQERVEHTAYRADPNVVNKKIVLMPYSAADGPVFDFYVEDIPSTALTGEIKMKDVAKISYDTNGNIGIAIKDMAGVEMNPQDVTVFVGGNKGVDIPNLGGVGIDSKLEAGARIYGTYNYRTGQFTSGGIKGGAAARIGSIAGVEGEIGHNVVTGLSSSDIGTIFAGKKIGMRAYVSWRWP